MTEDLVNAMKELIRCYEMYNKHDSPIRKEITMWREKFLSTADLTKDRDKGAFVWMCFLATPVENFLNKSPEKWIEEYKKHADEK